MRKEKEIWDTKMRREEVQEKIEADIGIMESQAKECWGLLAATKLDKKHGTDSLFKSLEGTNHDHMLFWGFWALILQEINFYCFKPQVLWSFVVIVLENQSTWF